MDPRSEANLAHVHPDLAKVIRAASQAQPFEVIQGLRTVAEEAQHVHDGTSQTMHSRHLPNKDGFACAIDFAALEDGHIVWGPVMLYEAAWANIKAAADRLGVPVEWGGAWRLLKDYGHVQLPWAAYP